MSDVPVVTVEGGQSESENTSPLTTSKPSSGGGGGGGWGRTRPQHSTSANPSATPLAIGSRGAASSLGNNSVDLASSSTSSATTSGTTATTAEESAAHSGDSSGEESDGEGQAGGENALLHPKWNLDKRASLDPNLKNLTRLNSLFAAGRIGEEATSWDEERECLVLLLHARMLLHTMLEIRLKEERTARGDLSIFEIQNLLKGQAEDNETDWIAQIQELKRNMVSEVRRNHALENDLSRLDKRIALLIKHRTNVKALLNAQQQSGKKKKGDNSVVAVQMPPQQLQAYQNLFYLLQTEPSYLARVVTLIQPEQMEQFLVIVMLSLYGDAFSPREEYLILSLFKFAIEQELLKLKSVHDLISADSVVPKMVITYNRRKQGQDYLKQLVAPVLETVIAQTQLVLELNANTIYQQILAEADAKGLFIPPESRNKTEDQCLELHEVQEAISLRVQKTQEIAGAFLDAILGSLDRLPYGIRWICKQIHLMAQRNFDSSTDDIVKVIGYFVYYRFINLGIVTGDAAFGGREFTMTARKNLVVVGRVLQMLFSLAQFPDKWMLPLNPWLLSKFDAVRAYCEELIQVPEPADHLKVDKYNELTLKVSPVVVMALSEISRTHQLLLEIAPNLQLPQNDPLTVILRDLPPPLQISDENDREIQLTLVNRFKEQQEAAIAEEANIYDKTKGLVITLFRNSPVLQQDAEGQQSNFLETLLRAKEYAQQSAQPQLVEVVDKIISNLKTLEAEGVISGAADNYEGFLRGVALEVANRASIRELQQKEIRRLTAALKELRRHQAYITEQIESYHKVIKEILAHLPGGGHHKPIKLSFKELLVRGVIVDAEVPAPMRKLTTFIIKSETPGVFDIEAHIAGKLVETIQLELDDLLEKSNNKDPVLKLDNVSLDVNMTLQLLNKHFLKA